jgi:hypothetical protein
MKELSALFTFLVVLVIVDNIVTANNKDREIQIKQLDRQWKLDSIDKAERRKMDKDLETLRLKLQNESRR